MRLIKISAKSFFTLFAVMRLFHIQTRNPLSIILFLVFFYIYMKLQEDHFVSRINMKDLWLSNLLSLLFAGFTIANTYQTVLFDMENFIFCTVTLLSTAIGLIAIYYHLILCLLQASDLVHITGMAYQAPWLPYVTMLCCLICWLPYFLHAYPGVMTPDSINQYAQVLGVYELSNHHSIVHTALIGMFYQLGLRFTNDVYFGLALYTLAQMIFMAFAAGYVVKTLQKADIITPILIAVICFYALMPYNGALNVTIWKDIPFAGAMTIFCAALLRFLLRPDATLPTGDMSRFGRQRLKISEYFTLVAPYVFSGVLLCLLRPNGWYAFLLSLPFILFVYRSSWRTMVPIHLTILALVLFVKYPCMNVYEIKQADFVESLSVPVQQIACVIAQNKSLSEEELNFVSHIMDVTQVASKYQPNVSDNIKNLIRETGSDYLEAHKTEFFQVWLSIGLSHPKAYFDAYVAQTNGYWYPDIAYDVGLAEGIYPNEFGLSWQPILRGNIVVKIKEILFKLHDIIPLYGALWSIGLIFWILLIAIAICLRSENTANALICLPLAALVLTLSIASPVAAEFRYAYALFYAMPIFLAAPFITPKNF